jgi:hypothetical protein
MCGFAHHFCYVRKIIPHISMAFVIAAFREGVQNENMMEKLAIRNIQGMDDLHVVILEK